MQAEENAIDGVLAQLAKALGPLSPFAKAVVPAALALAQLLVTLVVSGAVSTVSLTIGIGGVVMAVIVYLVPNRPRPVAPAALPPPPAVAVAA